MKNSRRLSLLLVLAIFLQLLTPVKLAFAEEGEDVIKEDQLEEIELELEDKGDGEEDSNLNEDDTADEQEDGESEKMEDEEIENSEDEEGEEDEEDEKGFHITLKYAKGLKGEEIDEENPIGLEEEFILYYEWSLDDNNSYVEGNQVSISLPKGIKIKEESKGELKDKDGQVYANYILNANGKLIFTFSKAVEENSNISGDFHLRSSLGEDVKIEDGKVIIEDPYNDGNIIELAVKKEVNETSLSKKGEARPAYRPSEIVWTIEIDTGEQEYKNAKLIDLLEEGLSFKPGSLDGAANNRRRSEANYFSRKL